MKSTSSPPGPTLLVMGYVHRPTHFTKEQSPRSARLCFRQWEQSDVQDTIQLLKPGHSWDKKPHLPPPPWATEHLTAGASWRRAPDLLLLCSSGKLPEKGNLDGGVTKSWTEESEPLQGKRYLQRPGGKAHLKQWPDEPVSRPCTQMGHCPARDLEVCNSLSRRRLLTTQFPPAQ